MLKFLLNLKIWVYFIIITVLQGLAQLLLWPEFIPEWEGFQEAAVTVLIVLAVLFAGLLIRALFLFFRQKFSRANTVIIAVLFSLMGVIWFFYFYLFAAFRFGQGFLGPVFVRSYPYAGYSTTLYLYNSGFLRNKRATVKIRKNILPVMQNLTVFEDTSYEKLVFSEENGKVTILTGETKFSYDLKEHKIVQ